MLIVYCPPHIGCPDLVGNTGMLATTLFVCCTCIRVETYFNLLFRNSVKLKPTLVTRNSIYLFETRLSSIETHFFKSKLTFRTRNSLLENRILVILTSKCNFYAITWSHLALLYHMCFILIRNLIIRFNRSLPMTT